MSATPVEIRASGWARAYVVSFAVVWCGLALSAVLRSARHGTAVTVVGVLMLVLGATTIWRVSRLGAATDGDLLTVRNGWRTRVLARSEIEGTVVPVQGARNNLCAWLRAG